MEVIRRTSAPDRASAWKTFVNSGEIAAGAVSPPIADSWRKCARTGVDPADGKGRVVLEHADLRRRVDENRVIVSLAKPFMQNLYQFFRTSGFIIVLTDAAGYILESFGDTESLQNARTINFLPGADWQDVSVGTNAIGTALATGAPIQVSGHEHFCLRHHCWTCSAAPIIGQGGKILAVLDVSGPAQACNSHTLAMVVAAAEAISMQLAIREKNRELAMANRRLTSIFNTMSEGVILIDRHGVVNEVNAVVGRITDRPSDEVVGRPIEKLLGGFAPFTRRMLADKQPYADIELMLPGKNGASHCLVSGEPVTDGQGQISGGVIVVRPIKQVRTLVNRFSGYYTTFRFSDIIGASPQLLEAVRVARLAAAGAANVLLQGESGTGKELFAQAIHHHSPRSDGPFIVVNCGAIPRELIGSELFGYEEGAFTGAARGGRPGKFELAGGGTVFLDEIGDMPLEQQAVLLRVLQEKKLVRVGGSRVIPADVRVICATNKDLAHEVVKGTFRQDLYYRLNVIAITIPPLRDRGDDILLLFDDFLARLGRERGRYLAAEPGVLEALLRYRWPGNVRELHNAVERAVNLAESDTVRLWHLPPEICGDGAPPARQSAGPAETLRPQSLREQARRQTARRERQELAALLGESGGNISLLAKRLGVARSTIYRRLRHLGLDN
ncbi:sigma-54-dependent Fis family transcriptional regulator [Anaeroselena agilis]|uniref:Sigma-54-dependent Fis family transcriptional regulator n=1 Tax=Anaeroselena agilis TaxID=3063788 RepID=A0ABU3NXU6_9FIRM|nr:sigma-54-dependent Fis family transcriptional regulator [Selenomonadales bacterium 4137-cl]